MSTFSTHLYKLSILLLCVVLTHSASIFVSRTGHDIRSCGLSKNTSCGTLYFASTILNESYVEIYVVDGQNEMILNKYMNTTQPYHPCLITPLTQHLDGNTVVTISFDELLIQTMSDWYPQSCILYDKRGNNTHANMYMFEASKAKLIMNNLQIDLSPYDTYMPFGVIGVMNEYTSDVFSSYLICNQCVFKNIYNQNSNIKAIYSTISITFISSIFANINTLNPFITMGFESLVLNDVHVSHCVFGDSFIQIEATEESYNDGKNDITLKGCTFSDIRSEVAIVDDQWSAADVSISNTSFLNIHNGSIYLGAYESGTTVTMEDIIVFTSQIAQDNTQNSLFDFKFADDVLISRIAVTYAYDANVWCEYRTETDTDKYYTMNVTYIAMECAHPVSLISNSVSMTIESAQLQMNVTQYNDTQLELHSYDYVSLRYSYHSKYSDYVLISNQGTLNIYDMTIYGHSIGRRLIYNQNILNIDGLRVINDGPVDPNALESVAFIKQARKTSVVSVYNSHFIGTNNQIHIRSGSAMIYDTLFEDAGGALQVETAQRIVISRCNFTRVGRYWSNIEDAILNQNFAVLDVEYVDDTVLVEYNHFLGGFDDLSQSIFVEAADNKHFILRNNYFMANGSDLYYSYPSNEFEVIGMLWFIRNYNVSIYQNNFYKNEIHPEIPWIQLESNSAYWDSKYRFDRSLPYAPPCLSANNFSNYAVHAMYSEMTSCFRPMLVECVFLNCTEGNIAGEIDRQLHDKTSYLNLDPQYNEFELSVFTFDLDWSNYRCALDNIQISIVDEDGQTDTDTNMSLPFWQGNVLIIDSVLPSNLHVLYWNTTCDVVVNDRVNVNASELLYIARLEVLCANYYNDRSDWTQLELSDLRDVEIDYVDHFSATQIHFTSTSSTYYPGQKLRFYYEISDKLDRAIDINHVAFTDEFVLNLANEILGLSQNIKIEAYGICDVCASGVIMVEVGLNNNYSTSHPIQLSVEHGNLALKMNTMDLSIISCPIGFGPDSNEFHCSLCAAGMYNLIQNNTEPCRSCHEGENKGVQCYEGHVFVKNSYWIGFDDENEIISHKCPSWYCCTDDSDQKHCNYKLTNETNLCAEHRDANVPLCGACEEGYSQAMNSTKCTNCDRNYYEYLLLPSIFAICVTMYLIKCHPVKDTDSLELPTRSPFRCCGIGYPHGMRNAYFIVLIKTLILRNFMYYEQGLSSILWPTSITVYMPYAYSIASLFNFEINIPQNDDETTASLWCFFMGMTTKLKILTGLIPVAMTTILLLFMFMLIRVCECLKCQIQCAPDATRNPKIYRCCNTNYGKAFLSLTIICVGQLLSVSFKMLNCQYVASKLVHFYFGVEECTFTTWTDILSISFLSLIIFTFIWMLIVLTTRTVDEREKPNFALNTLCKYYTPQCYYWEFILLLRRVCLSIFAIFYTWHWFPIILIAILLGFLGIHHHYQPFRTREANVVEYYLISSTIIVIATQTSAMYVDSMQKLASYILALFIVVPCFLICAVIVFMLMKVRKNPDEYVVPHYKTYASTIAQQATLQSLSPQIPMTKIHNNITVSGELISIPRHAHMSLPQAAGSYGTIQDDEDSDDSGSLLDDNNTVIELQPQKIRHAKDAPYAIMKSLKAPNNDDPISFTHLGADNNVDSLRTSHFMRTRSGESEDATSPLCQRAISSASTHL